MLCSIIVPLYNKADFIEATLESLIGQRYQKFEVIVVDDGSKDDGPKRVQAIRDNRIRLISQENHGVSYARNVGIENAIGDLIFFLDADDWYLPEYLETIVAMASTYPSVAYFATNYRRVRTPNNSTMYWDTDDRSEHQMVDDLFHDWRFDVRFCTNSVAVRRTDLNLLKPCFPIGEVIGEDHDLWFRLAERHTLAYCPAQLVGYRVDVEGSLSSSNEMLVLPSAYLRL